MALWLAGRYLGGQATQQEQRFDAPVKILINCRLVEAEHDSRNCIAAKVWLTYAKGSCLETIEVVDPL
ncbi:hypothetical protein AO065_05730 [Pseudomonas viridiflava]|nr:hypothetical protein AAI_16285 [Pseudomonas viridiflava UASWS0038]KPL65004.1 hypothetical protein PVFL_09050 [Pseudomonas viridiflava]OAG91797.1 hypothetical protein AO065_05730 [Pseudomonas viridiflava]ODJ90541.1 hypothetical protein BB779_11345 [Pseudomonas viridiflava]